MTDKEKQSCGQLYNPTAGDICTMRKRGTDLARQFNSCEDPDEQKKILQTLFSETGENVRVNPPFDIEIGPDVKIYTTFHPTHTSNRFTSSDEGNYFKTQASPVRIDDDTWIGGNVTILPGVHIGKNVVIGAGSVVTKDIPDDTIAVGNPSKVIKDNK